MNNNKNNSMDSIDDMYSKSARMVTFLTYYIATEGKVSIDAAKNIASLFIDSGRLSGAISSYAANLDPDTPVGGQDELCHLLYLFLRSCAEGTSITDDKLIKYVTDYVAEFDRKASAGYKYYPYTTHIEPSENPPTLPKIVQ